MCTHMCMHIVVCRHTYVHAGMYVCCACCVVCAILYVMSLYVCDVYACVCVCTPVRAREAAVA